MKRRHFISLRNYAPKEIDALFDLAWEEDTPHSPVIVIDQHTNLSLTDLRDGVHPNDGGDEKMADAWFTGTRLTP